MNLHYCDPALHNGKQVAAKYLVKVDAILTWNEMDSFACCSNHLHFAIAVLPGKKFHVSIVK